MAPRVRYPHGGLYIVEGEVAFLMTAMRRGVRWSSNSYQDDDQDELIKGLMNLKKELNNVKDLSQVRCNVFVAPFLEIIKSEETTGPVTSLALAAVNKFIINGLIDQGEPDIADCVEAIANAVTHARFVGSDASGDGVVLMEIMEVLRALVLSTPGIYLSNDTVCEIMISCFRICFETRLNELLRRRADHCLKHMVQHLFSRLPSFVDDTGNLPDMNKMRTNSIESNAKTKSKKSKSKPKANKSNIEDIDDTDSELLNPEDRARIGHLATTPVSFGGNIVDMQGSLNQNMIEKSSENVAMQNPKSDDKNGSQNPENSETNNANVTVTENKEPEINEIAKTNCESIQESQADSIEKNLYTVQSPTGSVENLAINCAPNKDNENLTMSKGATSAIEEDELTGTIKYKPPYGSACIKELFRFLVSICSPIDKQNTEIMIHLGLSLIQVAFEETIDAFSNFSSLLELIKDDLSRNIILLLGSDRISILAADLKVSFLLFESQREHLKFQLEQFIAKLMDIVNSDSNRISYEQREIALEAIVRLWKIPGVPSELFINYDCGVCSINLYEELMKMFSKVLFNNASDFMGTMYSLQSISLDAIFSLVYRIEAKFSKEKINKLRSSRYAPSQSLPKREKLLDTKAKKRYLAIGCEKFNENPREGIAKLSEHNLLGGSPGHPDSKMIAKLLRENPTLDKKAIGEYLSKKENTNVLHEFVHSFNFENVRIDEAVRQYMETFRLPGEAPLISLLLENFAEHWHTSNNKPFASADAAFTLAYAIIMLNVDQHNHNVKRQGNPMTADQFKRNLKSVNGGADFDEEMIDEIYLAIKNEEIVMPAEQTGLVKENYLWKCLLIRGKGPDSEYLRVGDFGDFIEKDLSERAWAPIISALCKAYDKVPDRTVQREVALTFERCAAISAKYSMTSDLDTLIVSLCKFTGLASGGQVDQIVLQLGSSRRCQRATKTLFKITKEHGNYLRASWKNIVDCLQILFKANLLTKDLTFGEDFLNPAGKVSLIREPKTPKSPPVEQGIFSSLYSMIALDSSKSSHPDEAVMKKRARDCVASCAIREIIEETKDFELEALIPFISSITSVNSSDENISVFLLEILLDITVQNRYRVTSIWTHIETYLNTILTISSRENHPYLLERVTIGMLRLAVRLLREDVFASTVLSPMIPLTHLPSVSTPPLSRQIAFGLNELLKTGAANIHTTDDWNVVFNLLECSGAGALQPKCANNANDNSPGSLLRPVSPNVDMWVLVSPTGTEAPLPVAADIIKLDREFLPHDPASFVKCCDSLLFLVKDVAHVTPYNFEICINCVRTFAEAVLATPSKRSRILHSGEELALYQQTPIQLLEVMYTLHTKAMQVFEGWAEEGKQPLNEAIEPTFLWSRAWRPLLQGIARLCCDSRRVVRSVAIDRLQSTLLSQDLVQLSAIEWSQCLEQVLFPLLLQLLDNIATNDPKGVEETRIRAAALLSKVFLHHLNLLLTLRNFLPLWLTVLELLRDYMHADNSESLYEAIPESVKNMLLVMAASEELPNIKIFTKESPLWTPTWRAINSFLPHLREDLFPEPPPLPPATSPPAQVKDEEPQQQQVIHNNNQVISLVDQQHPLFPKPIPPKPEEQQMYVQSTTPVVSCAQQIAINPTSQDINLPTSPNVKTIEEPLSQSSSPVKVIATELQQQPQVITLISQPPPSVSSPIAVQPIAQHNFDIYHTAINITDDVIQQSPQKRFEEASVFQDSLRFQQYTTDNTISNANEIEVPVSDTAIFTSAAYFSEDPTADRLFAVTNP